MSQKLARLRAMGVRYPIMQAGMPGLARVPLAVAVARAGGIGTLGLQDLSTWEDSLAEAQRQAAGLPLNANLLLPYVRRGHVRALLRQRLPMATLFWGDARPWLPALHGEGVFVWQQVGSLEEAQSALAAGVDGLIVQGREAGGHVRGRLPLAELLPQVAALGAPVPLLAAGGMYCAADVRRARALGADGVSTGSRFLLTPESHAHDLYRQRLLAAGDTLETTLFGLGWAAPHRVLANAATSRWCDAGGRVPGWLQGLNRALGFTRRLLPFRAEAALGQRPGLPLFSPAALDADLPGRLVESTALYAGAEVARLREIRPAEAVVRELAAGL